MTLQEQMIKAMDEADRYSNKPFLREDAAKVCAEIAEQYARSKWDEACKAQVESCLANWQTAWYDVYSEGEAIEKATKPEFKP